MAGGASRIRPLRGAVLGLLACALWALAGGALGADIYKWTDDAGHVHYADRPTSDRAQAVRLRPDPPPDPEAAARRAQQAKLLRAMDEDRAVRERREQKARQRAAHLNEQCRQARRHLRKYQGARYLYRTGGDGQREILSQAQRAAATKALRAQIEQHCN